MKHFLQLTSAQFIVSLTLVPFIHILLVNAPSSRASTIHSLKDRPDFITPTGYSSVSGTHTNLHHIAASRYYGLPFQYVGTTNGLVAEHESQSLSPCSK